MKPEVVTDMKTARDRHQYSRGSSEGSRDPRWMVYLANQIVLSALDDRDDEYGDDEVRGRGGLQPFSASQSELSRTDEGCRIRRLWLVS